MTSDLPAILTRAAKYCLEGSPAPVLMATERWDDYRAACDAINAAYADAAHRLTPDQGCMALLLLAEYIRDGSA